MDNSWEAIVCYFVLLSYWHLFCFFFLSLLMIHLYAVDLAVQVANNSKLSFSSPEYGIDSF
jgi:hypothetical protein